MSIPDSKSTFGHSDPFVGHFREIGASVIYDDLTPAECAAHGEKQERKSDTGNQILACFSHRTEVPCCHGILSTFPAKCHPTYHETNADDRVSSENSFRDRRFRGDALILFGLDRYSRDNALKGKERGQAKVLWIYYE
jgi:hypothetical protein